MTYNKKKGDGRLASFMNTYFQNITPNEKTLQLLIVGFTKTVSFAWNQLLKLGKYRTSYAILNQNARAKAETPRFHNTNHFRQG